MARNVPVYSAECDSFDVDADDSCEWVRKKSSTIEPSPLPYPNPADAATVAASHLPANRTERGILSNSSASLCTHRHPLFHMQFTKIAGQLDNAFEG